MGIECLKMFLIYQRIFQGGCSILYTGFCRFTRNSSCPGISPQRCLAHIIAKSYHFRTVIQLSRYTRENIPQGVTFKTPIFVRFFKKLKLCIVAQKHTLLIGRHLASLKKRLFLKLFSENWKFVILHKTNILVLIVFNLSRGKGLERQKIKQIWKLFYFC